nr:protein-methionine-sulfoxide reductase heme-binding subunit MsrQ [Nitrogeniibacter mangrovi]
MLSPTHIRIVKSVLFIVCLVPLSLLVARFFHDDLGANPIETITHATGDWTLRFLLITLAVTPLRRLTGWHWLIRLRRMLGLYAFFYATLHFLTYVVLDQFFDGWAIVLDVLKRPYITVGFAAFVLLIPLAVTSTNRMIKRLGGKRWQALHRSVYAIAILGVVHYWWLVKADLTEPILYGLILAGLLGVRAHWRNEERKRQLGGAYATRAPGGPKIDGRIIPIHPK